MSEAAGTEGQDPLPKRLKLCGTGAVEGEESASGGSGCTEESGEATEMFGGLVCKFLREADVGITEYICPLPGFFAVLKQRYNDFLVREITANGELVKLTSLSPPLSLCVDKKEAELTDVFSSTDIDRLKSLSSYAVENREKKFIDIEADSDKEKRTAMHSLLKTHFPGLTSQTVEEGGGSGGEGEGRGGRVIRVWPSWCFRDKRSLRWPGGKNKYCRFTLYKENRDAVDLIGYLSRQLGVKSQVFQSAGLKDRRAITTQHYTAFKVTAENLLALNGSLINVKIGDPVYVNEPLKLGQLAGNNFTIVLRNVSCDDHMINEKMTSLRDNGFINYFGMQRFGTSSVPTYHIGRYILHSDWRGAVDAILMPRPGEGEGLTSARQYFMETRDAEGTLEILPRGRPLEKALLDGLAKRGPNDYLGALKCIPYSSRLLYVHSYQSLVWNRVVTHRIREHGLKPIPGDLVSGNGNKPQVITEEMLPHYTIHDVILPLPGYDVMFPSNKVRERYEAILAEEKLTFQHLKHKVRDFILHGSYRHIVVKPKDVEWDILLYNDVTVPLVLTDCDVLDNKPSPQSLEGGRFKAIRMCFSLPTASYATMAVRELTKAETSSHYQTQLNSTTDSRSDNSTLEHVPCLSTVLD